MEYRTFTAKPTKRRKTMSTMANFAQVQSKNFRLVFFVSRDEFKKALQTKELYAMPYVRGPCSLVVPVKIVSLFKKRGVKIHQVLKPINKAELTPEQREDVKKKKAFLFTSDSAYFFTDKELSNWFIGLLEKTYTRNKESVHAPKPFKG